MLEQKYTFHPDLKTYEKQKAIIAPIADRALQALMGVQYRMEKDDDNVCVTQYRVPTEDGAAVRTLIYTPKDCTQRTPCLLFYPRWRICI